MDLVRHKLIAPRAAVIGALAFVFAGVGCTESRASDAGPAGSRGEGGSPVSLDSALALFRKDLPVVRELEGGAPTMDGLVSRLVAAIQQKDTTEIRSLVMSRAEFAYLYYPTSAYTRAPTKQEPGLAWFLHLAASQKGATRLLDRLGSDSLRLVSSNCGGEPRIEGLNRLTTDCVQRLVSGSDTTVIRLFSGILERNGRFKIFSYANDF